MEAFLAIQIIRSLLQLIGSSIKTAAMKLATEVGTRTTVAATAAKKKKKTKTAAMTYRHTLGIADTDHAIIPPNNTTAIMTSKGPMLNSKAGETSVLHESHLGPLSTTTCARSTANVAPSAWSVHTDIIASTVAVAHTSDTAMAAKAIVAETATMSMKFTSIARMNVREYLLWRKNLSKDIPGS